VAGPWVETLAEATATGGIIFLYGLLSLQPTPFPLFRALKSGLTLRGYTLFEISTDAERLARGVGFVTDGIKAGAFRPKIDRTFPLDDIVAAHRYLESNEQIGKIVVTV
jgi:NADPH:quinone reductase-like Zn-dependent oxidoreductase